MVCILVGGGGGGPVNHHSMAAEVDHFTAISDFVYHAQDELVGGTNLSSVSMESAER